MYNYYVVMLVRDVGYNTVTRYVADWKVMMNSLLALCKHHKHAKYHSVPLTINTMWCFPLFSSVRLLLELSECFCTQVIIWIITSGHMLDQLQVCYVLIWIISSVSVVHDIKALPSPSASLELICHEQPQLHPLTCTKTDEHVH